MKVKTINRNEEEYTRERSQDLKKVHRNLDPSLHQFQVRVLARHEDVSSRQGTIMTFCVPLDTSAARLYACWRLFWLDSSRPAASTAAVTAQRLTDRPSCQHAVHGLHVLL